MFRDKAPDGTIRLTGAIPVGGEAGPAGPQGPPGPEGPIGPQGPEGTVDPHNHNDLYFTEAEADAAFVKKIISGTGSGATIKRVRDLAWFNESASNLSGWLVIHTSIPFTNSMWRLNIKGYNYLEDYNLIDLDVGFYNYSVGPQFIAKGMVSKGNMPFKTGDVALGIRASDSTVVIILRSPGPSALWQYPKLVVDGFFGHAALSDEQLSGWTIVRTTSLGAYTGVVNPIVSTSGGDTGWIAPTLGSGWTNWDSTVYGPAGYRRLNGEVHIRGLLQRAAANTGNTVVMSLPVGFRPARRILEPAVISYSGGTIRRDIQEDGNVVFPDGGANPAGAYFSIAARFPVDQ